ncbi:hypothetical protein BKA66DRAFT_435244, partial [Pyrenochaeta sp. MPI-SDFR-AT-0127]
PVRSPNDKPLTGGSVVRWVTTGEYPLLYVIFFLHLSYLLCIFTVSFRSLASQDVYPVSRCCLNPPVCFSVNHPSGPKSAQSIGISCFEPSTLLLLALRRRTCFPKPHLLVSCTRTYILNHQYAM